MDKFMVSTGWIRNRISKKVIDKSLNIPLIIDGMDQVYFYSTINIFQKLIQKHDVSI